MSKLTRVVIMAGGTGGHVFPALAVARELQDRAVDVQWIGTPRGIENRLVPEANIPLHHIRVEGVRGKGAMGLLKAPFLIISAVIQAIRLLRYIKPTVVIGFGGFASGPGGVAAKVLGIPLVIHEQNAIAGTTNRLLSRLASRVLTGFEGAFEKASIQHVIHVGNPVRADIIHVGRSRTSSSNKPALHVLVVGGSLGAKAINEAVPTALAVLDPARVVNVWHQTGKGHDESTRALYEATHRDARVEPFIDDMASAYAWADVVICRAGALTVAELTATGVPAILIPLPHAIDDHQRFNALYLVTADAGVMIEQKHLSADALSRALAHMFDDSYRTTLANNALRLAMPTSASQVADICKEIAHG